MRKSPRLVRRQNGRLYWIDEDGFFAPFVAGGAPDPDDDDDDGDDPDSTEDDEDDDDEDNGSTFTQEQVNRFLAKERKKSKRAIEKDLEDKLGMPVTDAVETLKKLAAGEKPEAQAAAERRNRELDQRESTLDNREMQLTVREKLQEAGVKPERVKRAVRLIEFDDEDPDDDDILSAIDELKADMPELFIKPKAEDDDDDDERPAPKRRRTSSSDAPRPPRKKPVPEDAFNLGAEKAKQYAGTYL